MADLAARVAQGQRPEDVVGGVESLVANGYVERDGESLRLTERGQSTRDAIEAETDRLYLAPWPPLSPTEIGRIYATLQTICDELSNV